MSNRISVKEFEVEQREREGINRISCDVVYYKDRSPRGYYLHLIPYYRYKTGRVYQIGSMAGRMNVVLLEETKKFSAKKLAQIASEISMDSVNANVVALAQRNGLVLVDNPIKEVTNS